MPIKLTECVCCGSSLTELLDWGKLPLANNYNIKELYPLKLNKCDNCFHLQLDEAVEPEILFKDYPYFSGISQTSLVYFKEIAELAFRLFPDAQTVLDISANDASQLDAFKELGFKTYGIDPAENLYPISTSKGHIIHCGMFPPMPPSMDMTYDIITAENVVAHTPNPLTFLEGCRKIMHDGTFLIVSTSQADMVHGTEYDTIYHEHISYFNAKSMQLLIERAGLVLENVFTNPIHGTSYIFVIKKHKTPNPVDVRIEKENGWGLFNNDTYSKWVDNCKLKYNKTKSVIEDYRKQGYKIIGCGAAAKGITFLNVSKTQMDFIVDTTPAKWYAEVCNTTIFPFEYLKTVKDEKVLFIVLAWNFVSEVTANVLKFRNDNNDVFITTNQDFE
jgi:2-polyprenyl-3-methyl-5-hydroxy-6-metoxy-1,4-benzoquinol methylase